MKRFRYIFLFLMGLFLFPWHGALGHIPVTVLKDTVQMRIYFKQGSFEITPEYRGNGTRMAEFVRKIRKITADSLNTVRDIEITTSASPEGGTKTNNRLCYRRSNAVSKFLLSSLSLPKSKFNVHYRGEDWVGLRRLVLKKKGMPHAKEVADIIKNVPIYVIKNGAIVDGREKQLMDLYGGRVWKYMLTNVFPELRNGSVNVTCRIIRREVPVAPPVVAEPVPQPQPEPPVDTVAVQEEVKTDTVVPLAPQQPELCTMFALKTNLLYDAITALNIAIEIPLSKRLSLELEYINPWWQWGSDEGRKTFKIREGGIEGRYWFGNREKHRKLNGWFAGIFAGGGNYDLYYDGNGYDGKYFVMGGISAGYAHSISRYFGLEYSLGVGFMHTIYQDYNIVTDTEYGNIKVCPYPWERNSYNWIGPLKARISFIWYISRYKKGGSR